MHKNETKGNKKQFANCKVKSEKSKTVLGKDQMKENLCFFLCCFAFWGNLNI